MQLGYTSAADKTPVSFAKNLLHKVSLNFPLYSVPKAFSLLAHQSSNVLVSAKSSSESKRFIHERQSRLSA